MQSYLQFRRIGLAAQAQIQRDLEKAQLVTIKPQAPEHTAPPSITSEKDPHEGEEPREEQEEDPSDKEIESGGEVKENENLEKAESLDSSPAHRSSASTNSSGLAEIQPVDIERHHTATTVQTQYTARAALGHTLTGIHARDRRTHEGANGKVFVVGWEGELDPLCPRNWSHFKRTAVTLQISAIAFAVTAASAIDSTILPQAAEEFGVSEVVESLATGIYLIGFGLGSLIAGPFSETFGRNAVYMGSLFIFMIWIMASGLAPNIGAQIAFRFLAGFCASTPLVCSGGSISDLYNPLEKTYGFPLYALSAFIGPILAPVIGSYIGPSSLISWRWTEWVCLIISGLVLVICFAAMPETYGPLLLTWKAAHLRQITGDDRFRAEHEIVDSTLFSRLKVAMTRPFLMLTEPIVMSMTLYLTVVYIVLFTFLDGYTYIFQDTYGISQGLTNVIFVAMFLGVLSIGVLVPIIYRMTVKELERARTQGEKMFNPEVRLWFCMLGAAPAIPISLFWMGWTANPNISIWSPIIASFVFGYGITGIFITAYMYIIDSYEVYSASALTFVSLVRYVVAGGMTVVGIPFYENVGVAHTCTILACIACVLVPIPYIFYKYGYIIRRKSKYAVSREV
ncbi:major facilitator superfamily transporter [Phyllosticta capitalensis]|uniref:Major facilitator superfamily transporter n=1 Tax=Phyllosticta capitalensis TaxID=121624 RepID=A0ABR1YXY6_9PEZI